MSINTPRPTAREGSKKSTARTLVALALAGAIGAVADPVDATPTRPQHTPSVEDGCTPIRRRPTVPDVNGTSQPIDQAEAARTRTCHDIARLPTVRQIIARGMREAREEAHTPANRDAIKFRVETVIRETVEAMDRVYFNNSSVISGSPDERDAAERLRRTASNRSSLTTDDFAALRDTVPLKRQLQLHIGRDLSSAAAGNPAVQNSVEFLAAYLYFRLLHVPAQMFPRPLPPSPFGGGDSGIDEQPNPFHY